MPQTAILFFSPPNGGNEAEKGAGKDQWFKLIEFQCLEIYCLYLHMVLWVRNFHEQGYFLKGKNLDTTEME